MATLRFCALFGLFGVACAASTGDPAGSGGSTTASGGGIAAGGVGGAIGGRGAATAGGSGGNVDRLGVLLFTLTEGYRHDSIEAGVAALRALGEASNWSVQHLQEPDLISAKSLSSYEVLVLLNTSGDIFDDEQQSVLETYFGLGLGLVGIHGAADTEHDWPFYGELLGARFRSYPEIQEASIVVEDPEHSTTAHLPSPWLRTDEWYAFDQNPRPDVHVLLSVDESSYAPGDSHMDGDHPIAWTVELNGSRVFYTGLGHTKESYTDPLFIEHLRTAIEWAGRRR